MAVAPRCWTGSFWKSWNASPSTGRSRFAGLVGGHNHVALRRRRAGVPRPPQFPSRRRPARRQLARLPAPGKALPQDVPGGAARARAHAAGSQRFHDGARRAEVRLRAQAGRARCATSGWCGWTHRGPRLLQPPGAAHLFDRRPAPLSRRDGRPRRARRRAAPPITRRWCANSSAPTRSAGW